MLDIRAETLRRQAQRYPVLRSFQRLQSQVAELRLSKFLNTIGQDGFSRCPLMPFWTLTSRNLPQGEKDEDSGKVETVFLLGLPAWLRGVIRPPEGWTVVEIDFSAQEVLIAGGLSGDLALIEDAQHDPYLRFAARAGLVGWDADPARPEVKHIRAICKVCLLGSMYGQTPFGLAHKLGCSFNYAVELQRMLARVYPVFWKWSLDVVAQAQFDLRIVSPFGWPLHVTSNTKRTTLKNYKMQSAGADALRLAVIAAYEAGIRLSAPLHDSLWAMFPTNEYPDQLATLQRIMARASQSVCGIPCRTKAETVVTWPNCLGDTRQPTGKGAVLWAEIMGLIRSEQVTPSMQVGS
jgi:DNA polymerase I